mmetsp:Transcript_11406/g.24692  ORF Transcript_11406/g.24692 Transcript_11406/m.24692 type:complete len:436 (+) Transcript_11406:179-1486(+)
MLHSDRMFTPKSEVKPSSGKPALRSHPRLGDFVKRNRGVVAKTGARLLSHHRVGVMFLGTVLERLEFLIAVIHSARSFASLRGEAELGVRGEALAVIVLLNEAKDFSDASHACFVRKALDGGSKLLRAGNVMTRLNIAHNPGNVGLGHNVVRDIVSLDERRYIRGRRYLRDILLLVLTKTTARVLSLRRIGVMLLCTLLEVISLLLATICSARFFTRRRGRAEFGIDCKSLTVIVLLNKRDDFNNAIHAWFIANALHYSSDFIHARYVQSSLNVIHNPGNMRLAHNVMGTVSSLDKGRYICGRRHLRDIILFVFLAEIRAGILFLLCIGVLLRHARFNLGRLLLAVGGAARRDASLHESAELVVRREGLAGVVLVEIVDEFEEAIDAFVAEALEQGFDFRHARELRPVVGVLNVIHNPGNVGLGHDVMRLIGSNS